MLLIVACSSQSGETNNTEQSGGEKIRIEYWYVNSTDWGGKAVEQIIQNFNSSRNDIEVVGKYIPNQYQGIIQQAQAAIAGNNPPDVSQMGYNYLTYVNDNLPYTPIEQVARLDEKEPNFIKDNFLPNIIDLSRAGDGTLVGLSYGLSNPVLYYNADLLREVGWDPDKPPQTWEEVIELSKIVKDKKGVYGLYIQDPPDNWAQYSLVRSNGGNWLETRNGKLTAVVDSPAVIEVYQMMGDMVKEGLALNAKQEEGEQAFGNGRVAMLYTTIGRMSGIKEKSNFDLRTAKSPTFGNKPRVIAAGGNSLVVFSKDEKKKRAAWEFIKFLQSPQSLKLWVEGTGYLPPREGVADDPNGLKPFLESNPLMKAALEQKDSTVQWANFPGENGLQAEQVLIEAREQILSGRSTAEEALKRAAERINQLLP
jgi:multiple sugar transport system substrate-binding protein